MAGARPDTWMPMYWGDYLKDTGHLSTLEHGAYLMLIGHYWSSGQPLPDDDAKLRRIAKVESGAQWKKLRPVMAAFFQIGGGLWRHGRVEGELSAASKRSTDAKAKAKKAAGARWQGQHEDIPEAPHGGGDEADEDDSPVMRQACSKHSVSDAPSIEAEGPVVGNSRKMSHKIPQVRIADFESSNSQPIEIVQNRDACSTHQAMLEQCPSQPQSYLHPPADEKVRIEAASESSSVSTREMVDEAYRLWLPVAYELRIPDPLFLNPDRRTALTERLVECGGIERWLDALARLREARFLRDPDNPEKPKHWVNLMTLLKPETFTGLLEGRYAEHRDDTPKHDPGAEEDPVTAGIRESLARRHILPGG